MTIPSRPAPAPPGSRAQNAAEGANASLEQLRLQLAQQHQQQQQNGGIQRMTIKLPPPPKGPTTNGHQQQQPSNYHNNNNNINSNSSSITRKFPQARYAPATDWDDSPFDATNAATANTNGNFKKVPPPRPPPPKVKVNGGVGRKATAPAPPPQSANILTQIFNRKRVTKAPASQPNGASRVYGVSSGNYGSVTATSASSHQHNASSNSWNNAHWNSNNSSSNHIYSASSLSSLTATSTHFNAATTEAQLISFDSPPSSPTFTQKSNSDCVSVDSFSSDSNFSSPNNGSVSQPESGFEDDFSRSRPPTTSPLDPWETIDAFGAESTYSGSGSSTIGTAPVRNFSTINTRIQASNDNPLCNGKSLLPPAPSLTMPTIIKPKISQKPKAPKPPPPGALVFNKQHTASVWDADLPTPPSPAMPMVAPPPPPTSTSLHGASFSLLDVISGKVDAIHLGASAGATYAEETQQAYGLALYDFDSAEEGDLSFRENEKIYLLEQVSAEWYRGRTRAGCEGIFPANYIDIKVPLAANAATTSSAATTPTYQQQSGFTMQMQQQTTAAPSNSVTQTRRVRCLYNFPAEVEGDLALKENEMVNVLYKINEDWLYGEVIDGRQGQFPANFLEYLPANLPQV